MILEIKCQNIIHVVNKQKEDLLEEEISVYGLEVLISTIYYKESS